MRTLLVLAIVVGCGRSSSPPPSVETGSARVVTLTPSATEIVAALGAAGQLVGVDDFSTYPDVVRGLPKVGTFLAPNLEQIVRLRPTLVIGDDIHAEAAASLRGAGVNVLVQPVHALPDVEAAFTQIAERLGKAVEARAQIDRMRATIAAARARQPAARPRVLAVIEREDGGLGGMVAASTGSWFDELLAIVGAENAMAAAGVAYPKISVEEVLKAAPDVILDASGPADPARPMGPWAGLPVPAVANGRVRAIKDEPVLRPSPRIGEALAVIEAALR